MPHVTSAKWDRTLVLNIPIFIAIWINFCTTLELHFHLIIWHKVERYRPNTHHLEISGYLSDPWWRELYIDLEFSRLCFRHRPINAKDNGGRPPTPPQQLESNHYVLVNSEGHPHPIHPPRYYILQYLNLMGGNPTVVSGPCPEGWPTRDETVCEVKHHNISNNDNDDLLPLLTHPIPWLKNHPDVSET